MKRKTKTILAIALTVLLAAAFALNTGQRQEFAAVYEDHGITVIFKARNETAARKKAERLGPQGRRLLAVFKWEPPYPPPSTWVEESAYENN